MLTFHSRLETPPFRKWMFANCNDILHYKSLHVQAWVNVDWILSKHPNKTDLSKYFLRVLFKKSTSEYYVELTFFIWTVNLLGYINSYDINFKFLSTSPLSLEQAKSLFFLAFIHFVLFNKINDIKQNHTLHDPNIFAGPCKMVIQNSKPV